MRRGQGRKPGASLYTRKRLSLTGARAKAWCLLIHAEASLSHGDKGESLVPPYTCGSVSLSLTGARAKAWCLLIHAEASLSHGGQGESLVPPYTRGSVSLLGRDGLARAALLVHYLHVSWGARAALLVHYLYLHLTWGAGMAWTAYCTGNKIERSVILSSFAG